MKRVKYLVLCFVLIFCLTSCGTGGTGGDTGAQTDSGVGTQSSSSEEREGDSSALIVYFSAMGNTRAAAEILAEMQGAELCEIVPEEPYTEADLDYNNDSCRANEEQNDDNARPAISGEIEHIEDYDVIYVGFPIWWGGMPKILYTFFDTYDLSGKTIAPFCTSGGSGISGAVSEIEALEPSATVTEGLRTTAGDAESDFNQWLSAIGMSEQ